MNNREALEQELRELEGKKTALFEDVNPDQVAIGRLNSQINEVKQQLSNLQQREVDIEEKVSAEVVPFSILGINLDGYPTPIIELLELVYRTTRKYTLNEGSIELEQAENEHRNTVATLGEAWEETKKSVVELGVLYEETKNKNDRLEAENRNYELLIGDAESKRDAAVWEKQEMEAELMAEINERNETITSLKQRLEDYERNAEYQERQEQPLTVSSEESTRLQEKADVVKKLFLSSENWGSSEKLYLPDGTFTVIPRKELEEWQAADIPESVVSEVIPAPQLNTEIPDGDTRSELDGNPAEAENVPDGDSGTVAESFEEATHRRLALLETTIFGEIKAVA
jgi:predicted  nucleic acid-binding Zn-ribbon protein